MAIELDRLECKGVVTLGEFKCDALHGGSGAMLTVAWNGRDEATRITIGPRVSSRM